MRPLRLTMAAFGPFAGVEVIDFERLGPAALFLIEGATGAGKTTILDAICFALYDRSTGGERDAKQMRSHFAAPDQLTEVELVFVLGDTRYRIRRVPEQTRPSKRGDGTTTQNAVAELYRLEGEREVPLVARKVSEANAEITRLTGLTVDQFRQVMVLPQGQFRKLLTAESKDRQAILQNLFGTALYSRVAEALKARASELAAQDRELNLKCEALLQSVAVESTADLETASAANASELDGLGKQQLGAQAALQSSTKALAESEQLSDILLKQANVLKQLSQLDAETPQQREREHLLAQLDAAVVLLPVWQARSERLKEQAQAEAEVVQAESLLSASVAAQRDAVAAFDQATAAMAGRDALSARLRDTEQAIPLLAAYNKAESAHRDSQAQLLAAERAEIAAASASTDAEASQLGLVQQLNDARVQAASLEGLEQARAQRERRQQVQKDCEVLRASLNALHEDTVARRAQLAHAQRAFENASQVREQAEGIWTHQQARVLAAGLRSGAACLVCGSTAHPAPANTQGELLAADNIDLDASRTTEQRARESLDNASVQARDADRAEVSAASQLSELESTLAGFSSGDDADLDQNLSAAQSAAAALDGLEASALAAQQHATVAKKAHLAKQAEVQQILRAEAGARAERDQTRAGLGETVPDASALEAERVALARELEVLDTEHRARQNALELANIDTARASTALDAARFALTRLAASADEHTRSWRSAIDASPFADEAAFLATEERLSERESVERACVRYAQARQSVTATVALLEQSVAGRTAPDLEALRRDLVQRRDAAEAIERQLAEARARAEQLERTQRALATHEADRAAVAAAYRVTGSLSQAANGQNPLNLNLQSFVLSVLLDDVLIAAGERLQRMTRGRYHLIRRTGKTHGARQAGLDLDVEDSHTGVPRRADTLSGGESFMAALALALGLSDVVQAYAGGIRLDALFIDEGFGSLDPESLDLAVRALVDLQSSGRLVGVISHVPELAEQIPSRLTVRAGPTGSHAKLIVNPGTDPVS